MLQNYPKDVILADGTRVTLRPLVAEDEEKLVQLFAGISEQDMRFLQDNVADPAVVRRWCRTINYSRVLPIVAEIDGTLIADATLHRRPVGPRKDVGEFRCYVHPDYRHRGLATILIREIAAIATAEGLRELVVEVFVDARDLIAALERRGFIRQAILPAYQMVVLSHPLGRPAPEITLSPRHADRLPPAELWPTRVYTLPEFARYPDRLNPTEELLDQQVAAGRGERVAILFNDQRITYSALLEQVNRLGSSLQRLGVQPGDAVMLRAPNIPEMVVANFAVLKIGAVSVPASPLFSRAEIAHVARDAEVRAILVHAALLGELEAAREHLPDSVRHIIVIGGQPEALLEKGYLLYDDLIQGGDEELAPVRQNRCDLAVLLYTSCASGPLKGTAHLAEELLGVPDAYGRYAWRVRQEDIIGGAGPMAFSIGYCTFGVIPYRFGAAASLLPRFSPEAMFATIEKHRITILSLLPTAYRKMLQVPDAPRRYDLSSLRLCTGGGEALTAQTYHDWKRAFNLEIYEAFGTTEMLYAFFSNTVNMRARPGSFGQVVPGYEVKVVDDRGVECRPGEIGHLLARGPTGTLYWRDPDQQARAVWDGWNRVGDFAYADEDGYFWFVSREDDVIKSSGYRIGPEEVEQALCQHPMVADAGVIGVPDPVRGQNVKALVVLKEGFTAMEGLEEELINFCRDRIAVYKLPRIVDFVDDLPRTPEGKLLRRVLRAREREKAG